MGKLFDKFKKLFSTSEPTETSPTPIPAPPTPTSPYPAPDLSAAPLQPSISIPPVTHTLNVAALISIAQQISQLSLFKSTGEQLITLLNTPDPTKESITSIIMQAQTIIDAQAPSLAQLNQSSQYQALIKEMLALSPLDANLDHEHLAESNVVSTMQSLTKYYNVLEKLLTTSTFSPELQSTFNNLTQPLTQTSLAFNDLITQFKTFKSQEETLRQEIEGYAQAVEQMQSQNSMSPDWGGKKSAFEQKGNELTQKRNIYLEDENKINQSIAAICSQITAVHTSFNEVLTLFASELSNSPGQSHLSPIKDQIDAFQALVKQIATLII